MKKIFIQLLFSILVPVNVLSEEIISEFDLSPSEKLSLTIQTHFNTPCYDITLHTRDKPSTLVWIAPVDVNKVINDNIHHVSPHYGTIMSAKKDGSIISFLIKSDDSAKYIRRDLLKDRSSLEGTQSSIILKSIHDFSYPHNPLPKLEDVFSFSATSADGILKYYFVDESGRILPKKPKLDDVDQKKPLKVSNINAPQETSFPVLPQEDSKHSKLSKPNEPLDTTATLSIIIIMALVLFGCFWLARKRTKNPRS